jgi:hypothetical protein
VPAKIKGSRALMAGLHDGRCADLQVGLTSPTSSTPPRPQTINGWAIPRVVSLAALPRPATLEQALTTAARRRKRR